MTKKEKGNTGNAFNLIHGIGYTTLGQIGLQGKYIKSGGIIGGDV